MFGEEGVEVDRIYIYMSNTMFLSFPPSYKTECAIFMSLRVTQHRSMIGSFPRKSVIGDRVLAIPEICSPSLGIACTIWTRLGPKKTEK